MIGFVVDNGHVWGRPVGVTVVPDGSLLVTDDGPKSI
jgi:glucose/arabinose dehydrogenase